MQENKKKQKMIREKQCEERCKVKSNVKKGAKKKGIQRNEIQIQRNTKG